MTRVLVGPAPRQASSAVLVVLLALAASISLHSAPAGAQTADWVDIPVSSSLADGQYFTVVSSEDGTIEAQQQGTTATFGYPSAAACDGRSGDCYTSDPDGAGSIGFEGDQDQIRAALASLRFKVNDDVNLADATISVSTSGKPDASRDLFYNSTNGHYYEFIDSGAAITWQAAETAAEARTLTLGDTDYSGYLATVTTASESTFTTTYVEASDVWIGASDDYQEINEDLGTSITRAVRASDVVTITTAAAHGLTAGDVVPVSGFGTVYDAFNGVHIVDTVPSETEFTFAQTGTGISAGTTGTPVLAYADQAASEGQWYWVTGPEAGTPFWRSGTLGTASTQEKDGSGVRVNDRFDAWKTGEPNGYSGSSNTEAFGILNYSCALPCSATANWNDFARDNANVSSYLVEFGPFPEDVTASLSTQVEFSIPELIPAVYSSDLAIVCTPDPVAPAGEVTCEVTGGDPGIDILWRASVDGVFASQGVTLDADGRGVFTFRAPADADGRSIAVELVEWGVRASVAVSGQAVPGSLPAGGGSDEPPLTVLGTVSLLVAAGLAQRLLRRRSPAG